MKNRLVALPVDWMVSPAVTGIVVTTQENGDTVVEVDVATREAERRARIVFRDGAWVRIAPAASDTNSLPRGRFDMSSVPASQIMFTASTYLDELRALWTKLGVCPDPYFYEVADSAWLEETKAARFGCRHFVVRGRDMWLEVLAKDYTWSWTSGPLSPSIDVPC